MIKYEVVKDSFEFKQSFPGESWTAEEVIREYESGDQYAHIVGSFDTLDEAYSRYDSEEPDTDEMRAWVGHVLVGHVVVLWKMEIDEDGDVVNGDMIDLKAKGFNGDTDD